jgi:hypothetical protein
MCIVKWMDWNGFEKRRSWQGGRTIRMCCEELTNVAWAFEFRALRRIFGPKSDDVTGG